eukprot:scaffold18740_cov52-Prasinocladus_malaysianus.AAC.1
MGVTLICSFSTQAPANAAQLSSDLIFDTFEALPVKPLAVEATAAPNIKCKFAGDAPDGKKV